MSDWGTRGGRSAASCDFRDHIKDSEAASNDYDDDHDEDEENPIQAVQKKKKKKKGVAQKNAASVTIDARNNSSSSGRSDDNSNGKSNGKSEDKSPDSLTSILIANGGIETDSWDVISTPIIIKSEYVINPPPAESKVDNSHDEINDFISQLESLKTSIGIEQPVMSPIETKSDVPEVIADSWEDR
jgi:hypothetical protein